MTKTQAVQRGVFFSWLREATEEVGQFPVGRSGSHKGGRPKGSMKPQLLIVVEETREKLLGAGSTAGSRKMTKLEAAVMQLGSKERRKR